MSQNAVNRRKNRPEAKRLRQAEGDRRAGRQPSKSDTFYDPKASQAPGHRYDFKPEGHVPGRFGGAR